jgi:hypothetical protein
MKIPITPKAVLDGGRYFEGPRWHSGRLWFVDCMNRTLLSTYSGKIVSGCQLDDEIAMHGYSGARCYDQTSISRFCESRYRALDLASVPHEDRTNLHT